MQEVEQWNVGKIDMPTGFSPQKKCYLCIQKQTSASINKHIIMKRIAYLLAVCCLLPSMALGQKNIRYWEKGPLTWNDFTQVDKSIGSEHSYLEFGLDVVDRKQEISGLQIAVRTAVAFCNKDMSWVDINYRTPEQLRYNQVLFNLVELHRRRFQVAVDTGQRVNMDYYMRLLTYEVDSFSRACNYGNNTAQVLWWEDEIRRQMDSINPLMVEKHREANLVTGVRPDGCFGMAMGGGAKFFTGPLHDYFAPSGGFYFDVFGGGWRHNFNFGMYIGGGRCIPDSIDTKRPENKLYFDDHITTLDLHIDYGVSVIDNRRLTLTPFVGYGLQGVYYDSNNEVSNGPSEGCWRLGVDAQYDFAQASASSRNSVTLFGMAAHGKVYVCFDRFRSIVDEPRGLTLNFQLGLSFRSRDMKVLRPAVAKK